MLKKLFLCTTVLVFTNSLSAQEDFDTGIQKNDPVVLGTVVPSIKAPEVLANIQDPAAATADGEYAEVADGDTFHRTVLKAARSQVRKGEMSRRDFIRIRVAMLSPAFRKHAKNLAIIQMTFSDGDEEIPIVDEVVDWEGLIAFLEKLLPIILQLIDFISGLFADTGEMPPIYFELRSLYDETKHLLDYARQVVA